MNLTTGKLSAGFSLSPSDSSSSQPIAIGGGGAANGAATQQHASSNGGNGSVVGTTGAGGFTGLQYFPALWQLFGDLPPGFLDDYLMCRSWYPTEIDRVQIPVILRENTHLLSLTVIHTTLVNKFAKNVNVPSFETKPYRTTVAEAWLLNLINAEHYDYSLGMNFYEPGEEMVELSAFCKYYWKIKKTNLENLRAVFEVAVPPDVIERNKQLTKCIIKLKQRISEDIHLASIEKPRSRMQIHPGGKYTNR